MKMPRLVNSTKFNLQRLLLYVDSAEVKDRILAVDILGQCLHDINKVNVSILPDAFKKNSLNVPITFAILTRCEDVSPSVRTKALSVLAHEMKYVLQFFEETREVRSFDVDSADLIEEYLDANGTHRYFWYHLRSIKERRSEFEAMIKRRMGDDCPTTCKAAILAFQNLLVFHPSSINKKSLKYLVSASNAIHITVSKQVIQSVSNLLEIFSENSVMQEIWLECILPLIYANENSIQDKALSLLEAEFLVNIFSVYPKRKTRSLELLRVLCSGDFLTYQKFFKKAFQFWGSTNKLKSGMGSHLIEYIGTEWEESVWFYFSCLASYCTLSPISSELWIGRFTNSLFDEDKILCLENMLKVAEGMIQNWPLEALENISGFISVNLKSFSIPVALIPMCMEFLLKVHRYKGSLPDFENFLFKIIQLCEKMLSNWISPDVSEEKLAKCFRTLAEFYLFSPTRVPYNTVSVLMTVLSSSQKPTVPSSVKSHALVALGKFCLKDEALAKELFPVFTKEYFLSKHDAIRNNSAIILIDLCKRYSSVSDNLMPLMIAFFKDRHYQIRYQTIVLLVRHLLQGYIKWQSSMFYCLLSTVIDRSKVIQEIGRHSLSLLWHGKKHSFSEHFIDIIFLLNNFPPPDNKASTQRVKYFQVFALPGENDRQKRMVVYSFLLESTGIEERVNLIKSICDILKNVAEYVYPLNEKTECIIRDCFAILTCSEIRVINLEELENTQKRIPEEIVKDIRKTELGIRRAVIVDPVIQAMICLKNSIKDPQTDLMQDIIMFLKDLLYDFKESQNVILAKDRILLSQLELEMKNDDERARIIKIMRKTLQEENTSMQEKKDPVKNEINYNSLTHTQNLVATALEKRGSTVLQNQVAFDSPKRVATDSPSQIVVDSPNEMATDSPSQVAADSPSQVATNLPNQGAMVLQIQESTCSLNQVATSIVSQSLVDAGDCYVCSSQVINDERKRKQGIEMKNDDEKVRRISKSVNEPLQRVYTQTEIDSVDDEINCPVMFLQNPVVKFDTDESLSQVENGVRKRRRTQEIEQPLRHSQRLLEKLKRKM